MPTSINPHPVESVAVINKSDLSDQEVAIMIEGYRDEVTRCAQAWSLPVPGIAVYGKDHQGNFDEEAALFIVNSAGDPTAYGMHTAVGKSRFSYVDVELCRRDGEPVSRVVGHELFEMIADPDIDRWAGPYDDGSSAAIEISDPVQRQSRKKRVEDEVLGSGEIDVADWVTPNFFQPNSPGPWSDQGAAPGPLTAAPGGYIVRERNGVILTDGARERAMTSLSRTARRFASGPPETVI